MDPHSRLSQYNQRAPRAGPLPPPRSMEPSPKPTLPNKIRTGRSTPSASSLLTTRLIATNSRVKQDEKYRKDMYLAFVNNAFQEKANGNGEPFDELVNQFNMKRAAEDGPNFSPHLRSWLLALSHVLSRLERHHAPLIEAIMNIPWATLDSTFVKSYTAFIGMLLSARPEYLSLVLGKIAQGFTHQYGLQILDPGQPEGASVPLTRRIVYDRFHYLLRHLLSLIPTLPSTLQPLLVRNFPHKRQHQVAQTTYIRNLLRVTDYCPELADRILATVVDHAIQIDVEIQVELEELEDDESAQLQEDVFEIDPFDAVVGEDGDEPDSEAEDEDGDDDRLSDLSSEAEDMDDESKSLDPFSNVSHIQDMVKKLDAILKLLFDHFHCTHVSVLIPSSSPQIDSSPPSTTDSPSQAPTPRSPEEIKLLQRSQFHTLLSIFDRTIIRTFKSRYTQFLLFWYTSLDPEFSDLFQGLLVSKALLEHDQPVVTRAAAASYIASFISRAQFVDREGARRVMGVLCNFIKGHLDAFDALSQAGDSTPAYAHHSIFYAVAQAVFLIFCFRWRDMLEDNDVEEESFAALKAKRQWLPELGVLQRVINSPLQPLKVCSYNVVMQFTRVAHSTEFMYCYSILEAHRRSDGPTSRPSRGTNTPATPVHPAVLGETIVSELNTFFPFDPYKLPRSNSYIAGVYREWSSVAIDDGGEDDDDGDGDGEDEGEGNYDEYGDGDYRGGTHSLDIPSSEPFGDDLRLGASFEGMSISPAP